MKTAGLNLTNFKTKDNAIKASWVSMLHKEPFLEEMAYQSLNIHLTDLIWNCNLHKDDVKHVVKDITCFWKDVLKACTRLNYTEICNSDPGSQVIWYNSHICIGGKPFFWKKPYKKGLVHVSQLFTPSGDKKAYDHLEDEYGLNIFQVNQLMSTIPREWKIYSIDNQCTPTMYSRYKNQPKPCSFYYKTMTTLPQNAFTAYVKWQAMLHTSKSYDNFISLFSKIFVVTNHSKFRSLQYRILQCALVLNVQLYRWKIREDNLCTFCDKHTETYPHLFFDCQNAKELATSIPAILDKYGQTVNFTLTSENTIFNDVIMDQSHLVNFIVLGMKVYIYKNRCLKKQCSVIDFKNFIEQCRTCEYYNAMQSKTMSKYHKKWCNKGDCTHETECKMYDF